MCGFVWQFYGYWGNNFATGRRNQMDMGYYVQGYEILVMTNRLMSGTEYGIRLYRFLIIAFSSTCPMQASI